MLTLPADAFDANGIVKKEYIEIETYAAYPEGHSCWDKLVVPSGSMTLEGFQKWLMEEHKIKMKNWSFVLGWRREEDEGKEVKQPFSTQIYPPPVVVDASKLPPLTESPGAAMKAIMTNPGIPMAQKQIYNGAWAKAKQTGELPKSSPDAIAATMSLKDILSLMEKKADAALKDGTLFAKWGTAISGLQGRRFWLIPADQTPSCSTVPEDGSDAVDVRFLAAIQIPLA